MSPSILILPCSSNGWSTSLLGTGPIVTAPNEPVEVDEPLTNVDDTLRISLAPPIIEIVSLPLLPIPVCSSP